jgi:branched-chain amino acid transport system ATP-binding protein
VEEILSLQGVTKWFAGLHALTDINMNFKRGERVSIIGPNGAGKTTLFNVINGEKIATVGKIMLFGQDVTRKPIRTRVFLGLRRTYQSTSVCDTLTVEQNISLSQLGLGNGNYNLFSDSDKKNANSNFIKEIAEKVDLQNKLKIFAGKLSHGEKRQLEIGLAFACMPRIIMFDEPAAGLSPEERKTIIKLINLLPKEVTILLIEHDMEVAFSVAERVIVLHEGKVLTSGSPEEICSNAMVQEIYLGGKLDG